MRHPASRKIALLLATVFSAPAWSAAEVKDVAILWHTRNIPLTDHFYTIDPVHRDGSVSCCGYQLAGQTAYVFKNPEPWIGYPEFSRYYKHPPATDHFYTAKQPEKDFVLSQGFGYERPEGALAQSPVEGLTPLYRVNKFNAQNFDLEHFYTTNWAEVVAYQQQGYGYDGIQGYAFTAQGANNFASVENYNGRLYVKVPAAQDLRASATSYSQGACGGEVTLTIDGTQTLVVRPYEYGFMPGLSSRGCYADFSHLLSSGTHQIVLKHTGFAARFSSTLYNYWKLVPANERSQSLTKSLTGDLKIESSGKANAFPDIDPSISGNNPEDESFEDSLLER